MHFPLLAVFCHFVLTYATIPASTVSVTTPTTTRVQYRPQDAYSELDYPNPTKDFHACGVNGFSYICDPTRSLTQDNIDDLNERVQMINDTHSCLCDNSRLCYKATRHIIMVAVVPRIKYTTGSFPATPEAEIQLTRRFAEHLRDASWIIPDSGCSMRTYIVYDMHTKRIWTSTNYFAHKVITDKRATKAGLYAKNNYLRHRMLYQGFRYMVTTYTQHLKEYTRISRSPWWRTMLIIFGVIAGAGFIVGFFHLCRRARGGSSGGGGVWKSSAGTTATYYSSSNTYSGGGGGVCGGGGGG